MRHIINIALISYAISFVLFLVMTAFITAGNNFINWQNLSPQDGLLVLVYLVPTAILASPFVASWYPPVE